MCKFCWRGNKKIWAKSSNGWTFRRWEFSCDFALWSSKKETYNKIREFSDLLIKKTLELKGTITGEHGIGLHKKEDLIKEHGDNIPVMKSIKRTLDPNNIMNPGKIFDLN